MSLVKVAVNFKQLMRPIQRNLNFVGGSAMLGAIPGALIGVDSSYDHDKRGNIKLDHNFNPIKKQGANSFLRGLTGAAIGGTVGGAAGVGFAGMFDKIKLSSRKGFRRFKSDFYKSWDQQFNPPPFNPRPPKADTASFFKTHGNIDHTTIKTKKEAQKIYRDAARRHHPDMGGNAETFKKLSTDWNDIRNSQWFEKLAFLIKKMRNK